MTSHTYGTVPPPPGLGGPHQPPGLSFASHGGYQQQQQQHMGGGGYGVRPMSGGTTSNVRHEFNPTNASSARPAYSAAAVASHGPAYTTVASHGPQPQQQLSPQQWPPAVKGYVERCFKACKPSQREGLQQALKLVIQDAQCKGELWSRKWDTLPIPDLKMKAPDAAAIINRVAAATMNIASSQANSRKMTPRPTAMRPDSRFGVPQKLNAYTPRPIQGAARTESAVAAQPTMVRFKTSTMFNNSDSRKRPFSAFQSSDSESDVSQGGPFSEDEELRRQRRAGRFKNDKKFKPKSKKGGNTNRAKLAAMLESVGGDGEQLDWDTFALKVSTLGLSRCLWYFLVEFDLKHGIFISSAGDLSQTGKKLFQAYVCSRPIHGSS